MAEGLKLAMADPASAQNKSVTQALITWIHGCTECLVDTPDCILEFVVDYGNLGNKDDRRCSTAHNETYKL